MEILLIDLNRQFFKQKLIFNIEVLIKVFIDNNLFFKLNKLKISNLVKQ